MTVVSPVFDGVELSSPFNCQEVRVLADALRIVFLTKKQPAEDVNRLKSDFEFKHHCSILRWQLQAGKTCHSILNNLDQKIAN